MSLRDKIEEFKRRSLRVRILTASVLVLACVFGLVLLLAVLESSFWFGTVTRTVLFYFLLAAVLILITKYILKDVLILLGFKQPPADEQTARAISEKLPEIDDKLINYLQLEKSTENELARASLSQKSEILDQHDFLQAIDRGRLRRYIRVFGGVAGLFLLLVLVDPPLITSGAQRIVQHSRTFVRPAPFRFVIENDSLTFYKNKDFKLTVQLEGANIPIELLVVSEQGAIAMQSEKDGKFSHTFKNPTKDIDFFLESSGFTSQSYQLKMLNKPILNLLSIDLTYPRHTGLKAEKITNGGNITAPEGTKGKWVIQAAFADEVFLYFPNDTVQATRLDEQTFTLSKTLDQSGAYEIALFNAQAKNEIELRYRMQVIPDEAPEIDVTFAADTTGYKYVILTGQIVDDYGFHSLSMHYEINEKHYSKPIFINNFLKAQGFYTEWYADSIAIKPDEQLTIYAVVRDNDANAGYKSAKSQVFYFKKPGLQELSDQINQKSEGLENEMNQSLREMAELRKTLEEMAQKLKSQNEISWQAEKLLEESLEQRKELEKMLSELKKKHDDLMKASDNFEQSESLKEKSEQFNELVKDLMDESTRQLYEELQKLLQDKASKSEISNKLEQISRQENRLMKDLERTKELFKRLTVESGLERIAQQLDSLANRQMELSEQQPEQTGEEAEKGELAKQQEVEKDFEKLSEELEKMEQLNQELQQPAPLENLDADEKQIKQEMNKASEEIKSGDSEKSKKSQKNAAQQMQQMSQKMQSMQAGMEMEVMQENIEHLRKVMDDLIRLSYRQEDLLKNFRTVNSSDPRFITLSQDQLKLKEDLVVIEDSLLSIASRVAQLSSFITKEIDEIDMHMDASLQQIRERQQGRALSHQQFSMTSMNNLALLLDDVLQNLQMSMSESSGKGKGKPNPMPTPSLSEMQQQLGEQMKRLQDEGKSGRQLSEELARMAAEQEMIRQQLQEMQKKLNGQFGNENISDDMSQAIKLMEQNELDLVNKRLTKQLMDRQKEITTRLLEAENAMKEQKTDPEREGEKAKDRERMFPPGFEEYLNERKKEIELLRSVPIELNPFYKKEVNDYFRRLSEKN